MIWFQILTDQDLRNLGSSWGSNTAHAGLPSVTITDFNKLGSINSVIQNHGLSTQHTPTIPYASGFLDFLRYNNIYISSNIGSYQTLGPRPGQKDIVRKVPVNASSGAVINSRIVSVHDLLDCAKICMSTIEFRFQDMWGNTINLNGCHVSFSLVFTMVKEDT
jgi:hypothetical protein